MLLFAGVNFSGILVVAGFTVLFNQLVVGFDVSRTWVVILLILPSLLYIPMTLTAVWLYENLPTHHVVYITVLLQVVGCWIRSLAFVFDEFWPLFVGTAIFVSSVPLFTNAISLIANQWFPDNQRATATSLISLAIPVGSLFSLILSGLAASGIDESNQSECISAVKLVTTIHNFIVTVFSILTLLFFREKPPHPPSELALVRVE